MAGDLTGDLATVSAIGLGMSRAESVKIFALTS